MKKFLSILLVLTLVLSLGITALATENTGSITITNATIGETYEIYKIFDASIGKDDDGETDAVSYSISADDQFFEVMFGKNGTAADYFEYNEDAGTVTKKKGVNDSDLVKYLTELVEKGNFQTAGKSILAVEEGKTQADYNLDYTFDATQHTIQNAPTISFQNLPYGYYLITSSLGTTVTINTNTPDVQVIDKNQKPGAGFDKLIQTGVDAAGKPIWGKSNSANIADEVTYKITFEATNYDGENKIKYYQIHDEKGDAIWAEFNSFEVYVGGTKLERGYYLSQGGVNTDHWEYFGNWGNVEKKRDNAQWYLVHLDYDKFRITIPWLEGHTIADVTNADDGSTSYSVNFPENAVSKFDSPVTVEITYKAVVEATAAIGDTSHGNRYNKAYASWTSEHETIPTKPEEVVTYVYGIGLLKDDIATRENLAGAKFRIYKDKDCKEPVFVIPTDVDGVYIVDSYETAAEDVSGIAQQTTRKLYEDYLEAYLKDENGSTIDQNNLVVSQKNGKLAILGLKEGTYYLKEVEAPAGYNALSGTIELEAGEDIRSFVIFADKDGHVADIQQTDGVHHEISYDLTSVIVHNSKGVVLPSTGGEGTFWMITIGTLLAIGFAVFLITHKKMSIYTD